MKLAFLGAMGTVGCSAVFVSGGSGSLLLDYGTRPREIPPKFPLEVPSKPEAILLSHCHLDHSGALPLFYTSTSDNLPKTYGIGVTKPLTKLLLLDAIKVTREEGVELPFQEKDIELLTKHYESLPYGKRFEVGGFEIEFLNAGHIPGSAMCLISYEGKNVLYTGDFNTRKTRLVEECKVKEIVKRCSVDVLITESTYSDRDHPPRRKQEKELVRIIEETLANDGIALVAGFAVGRIAEILLVLDAHGIDYPLFIDGMAKKAMTIVNRYPQFLKEEDSLDRALEKVTYVNGQRMRKRIVKEPCVILTTSGMLQGGPVVYYLQKLHKQEKNSLILTGWQLDGTPGKILLETGRYINEKLGLDFEVKMLVRRLDFSAHAGRKELFEFVEKLSPQKVFCVHGDHTQEFAEELKERGYDAIAPLGSERCFDV